MTTRKRYIVSATLLTCSPLAIHSGFGTEDLRAMGLIRSDANFRAEGDWNYKILESCDQLVMRDAHDRPYVPGSSLKGVTREYLSRQGFTSEEQKAINWLLGAAVSDSREQQADQVEQGTGGAAYFEDAFVDSTGHCVARSAKFFQDMHQTWWKTLTSNGFAKRTKLLSDYAAGRMSPTDCFPAESWRAEHERLALLTDTTHLPYFDPRQLTYVEHQVGVDRRTGAAGRHKLFTSEVVPAGLPFSVQVVVDHHEIHALTATKLLLRALAGFNLDLVDAPVQLGSGTSHGWGRMACLFPTVHVQTWTPDKREVVAREELDILAVLKQGLASPPKNRRSRVQLRLSLHFDGPFLVNDPARVCVLKAVEEKLVRSGDESQNNPPDHVPRVASTRFDTSEKHQGNQPKTSDELWVTPLLPGSGFKGPIRSQLERILRTIHPDIPVSPHGERLPVSDTPNCPAFVQQMFGFESQQSGIWCTEFVGSGELEISRMKRDMVAIDRFTGGASNHAKFDVIYLDRPVLCGVLAFELPNGKTEAQQTLGAVALLLRDLLEGDVAFGFGDMKSFGQCGAQIEAVAVRWSDPIPEIAREIAREIAQKIGRDNIAVWLDQVIGHCQAGNLSSPEVKQADGLLDGFLAAVRESSVSRKNT